MQENTDDPKFSTRSTSISQRWDEEFHAKVRRNAIKTGRSMTQLTIDALDLYDKLIACSGFLEMKPKTREEYVVKLFQEAIKLDGQVYDGSKKQGPGLVMDKVITLLTSNPEKRFSSIEIAHILTIPQSTIRTYIRRLSLSDNKYVLIEGRPNFIYYKTT
ncbi:MAG: hypothetical protein ACXAD7_17600 [Candidatus Kariarchaeaceae archaeon]